MTGDVSRLLTLFENDSEVDITRKCGHVTSLQTSSAVKPYSIGAGTIVTSHCSQQRKPITDKYKHTVIDQVAVIGVSR